MKGVSLMVYPDSFGGNLQGLQSILDMCLRDCFSSIHILPPFPSTADKGFCPTTQFEIDPQFGTWDDISALSHTYHIELDIIGCHMSTLSSEFQTYLHEGEESTYRKLFLHYSDIAEDAGLSEYELGLFHTLTDEIPFRYHTLKNGKTVVLSHTFTPYQVDLNFSSELTWDLISRYISHHAQRKVTIIRLDAIQTAAKTRMNGNALQDRTYEYIDRIYTLARHHNLVVVPEVHAGVEYMEKMSRYDHLYVYDFSHVDVLLYMFLTRKSDIYISWVRYKYDHIPRCINVLTNHDGLAIGEMKTVLKDEHIEYVRSHLAALYPPITQLNKLSKNVNSRVINLSLFDALEKNEHAWVAIHVLHVFTPGIPQVYYNDILCAVSDDAACKASGEGRDLIRTSYPILLDVQHACQVSHVRSVIQLLSIRNTLCSKVVEGGLFHIEARAHNTIFMTYSYQGDCVKVLVSLDSYYCVVYYNSKIVYEYIP